MYPSKEDHWSRHSEIYLYLQRPFPLCVNLSFCGQVGRTPPGKYLLLSHLTDTPDYLDILLTEHWKIKGIMPHQLATSSGFSPGSLWWYRYHWVFLTLLVKWRHNTQRQNWPLVLGSKGTVSPDFIWTLSFCRGSEILSWLSPNHVMERGSQVVQ